LALAKEVDADRWTATWADDDTEVTLAWNRGWFITVEPSDARAARLVGLLGASNGDPRDDLLLPDGTRVDPAIDDSRAIDDAYARAWIVDDDTTLFDYAPGQSPDTFAAARLDGVVPEPEDATVATCRGALGRGATEQEVQACAFDVTATGDDSFVDSYVEVVDERVTAVADPFVVVDDAESTPPTGATDPGDVVAGEPSLVLTGSLYDGLADPGDDGVRELVGTLEMRTGAVLLARANLCTADVDVVLRVTRVETQQVAETRLCDPFGFRGALLGEHDRVIDGEAYVLIGADGEYDVRVTSDSDEPLYTEVRVFADPDPLLVDREAAVRDGWSGSLSITADAVVLPITTEESVYFSVATTDDVCFIEVYGPDPPGDAGPWPIDVCGGGDSLSTSPTFDLVLPMVVFDRTGRPADVTIERTE